ncbi:MAG: class I SAM-dependent methyltransferase [Candidatus Coatesbacteria bacterium]|nr:class I SAM-dependent methyltransferase [Candidatus Coatesbacteria bacterium]
MQRDFSRLNGYLDLLLPDVYERMETVNHRMAPDHIESALQAYDWFESLGLKYDDVLDIGCADGWMTEHFNRAGKNATGVTISDIEVELCRQRCIEIVHADMSFLPSASAAFDLVWCRDAIEHSVMPLIALFEFNRVLRPGKYAFIVVPTPDYWVGASNHYSVLTDGGWRWLFKLAHFEVLDFLQTDSISGEMRYILQKVGEVPISRDAPLSP